MITFRCRQCRHDLEVGNNAAGKMVSCPQCQARNRVPTAANVAQPDSVGETTDESAVRQWAKTVAIFSWSIIGVILSIVAVITITKLFKDPAPVKNALHRVGIFFEQAGDFASSFGMILLVAVGALCVILYIPFVLYMAGWTARDACNRGHSELGWCIFYLLWQGAAFSFSLPLLIFPPFAVAALVFGWIGLGIYLNARRRGTLRPCERCPNKKLTYLDVCPHCLHRSEQAEMGMAALES